jgi:copper chaperone CopZ
MLVTMNLEDTSGVTAVACNHATGKTVVTFDESKTSTEDLLAVIVESGYSAEIVN